MTTDMTKIMLEKAQAVLKNAYAPYSKFSVGVCLRSEDGELFTGCNIENVSYGLTSCAEASAIAAMIAAGKKRIVEVVVVGSGKLPCAPCGACRQRLFEFAAPEVIVHMYSSEGDYQKLTLGQLLPSAFTPNSMES